MIDHLYRCSVLIILLFFAAALAAQQNPPGINWKSIDTGSYEIIFPEEITPLGQRVANLMAHYEKYNYSDIKTRPRRIPIVLINNYSEPNAFVSFAPYYSHWFTTPSSFTSLDWYKGLAVHEGRHMAQLNKLKDGRGKGLWRIFFGDFGTAAFSTIYVPAWFFEGDAVVNETALTKGGRGRNPYFDLWQRGLELSDDRYTYYKSYLGSYDELYPYADHYRLGYLLCSYIQKHYGKDVWDRVLADTGRYALFFTFNTSLIFETGKSIPELYKDALDEYRDLWKSQQKDMKITEADIITPQQKDWKNFSSPSCMFNLNDILAFSARFNTPLWESYLYPSVSADGSITAIRFSRDKEISVVKFNENEEIVKIKHVPFEVSAGFTVSERTLSTGGNYALWRETVPDPRWGYRSFSDLKLLDLTTGKTRFISNDRKYIASTLTADGKNAIGIEYGPDLRYYISIIETETDSEIFRDEIKDQGYLFDPAVSEDGKTIALAALSDNGNALLLYHTDTKKITRLVDYTTDEHLRSPHFYGKYLIYGSDYSGIDNIYAIDINSKKRYQVTSRPLGAYYPSVSNGILYFNDYMAQGFKAASARLNPDQWVPLQKVENRNLNYIDAVSEDKLANDNNRVNIIPEREYTVNNYSPLLNSVNLIGWSPALSSTPTDFGIYLLSKDVLQTTDIQIGYIHNFNEGTNFEKVSVSYSGLYPVIDLNGGYGGRAVYLKDSKTDTYVYSSWNEVNASGGLSFPLNFSRGINSIFLNFGAETGYIKVYEKKRFDYTVHNGMNANGDFNYIEYFLAFSHLMQGAMNSVAPGTGEELNISYTHTPYQGSYRGGILTTVLTFYLPGITDTQGLKLAGSYEHVEYQNYIFPQKFLFPRGYEPVRHEQLYKGTLDYSFPVVNFSANIWKLVYFKRINGDIFFDYGAGKGDIFNDYSKVKTGNYITYYRSAGVELTAEQNWFANKYLALELGLRYSRCFDSENNKNKEKQRYDLVLKVPLY